MNLNDYLDYESRKQPSKKRRKDVENGRGKAVICGGAMPISDKTCVVPRRGTKRKGGRHIEVVRANETDS